MASTVCVRTAIVIAISTAACGGASAAVHQTRAPEPAAAKVILWQDNFNRSSVAKLLAPYVSRGALELVTDGHSGHAIRFPYTARSWDNLIEKQFPITTDIYFRYWYRISPGADPTCRGREQSGFKWFMPWRLTTNLRYTMGVGNLTGGPAGFQNTGLEFSTHDNTSATEPAPFMQNINKTKTFRTTADGAWHEIVVRLPGDERAGEGQPDGRHGGRGRRRSLSWSEPRSG